MNYLWQLLNVLRNRRIVPWAFLIVLLLEYMVLESHLLAQTTTVTASPLPQTLHVQTIDWTTIILQILLLVTTLAGFTYTIYRENRNRRWDLEDRREARKLADLHANERTKVVKDAIDENTAITSELDSKITKNTAITTELDSKIADISQKIMDSNGHDKP